MHKLFIDFIQVHGFFPSSWQWQSVVLGETLSVPQWLFGKMHLELQWNQTLLKRSASASFIEYTTFQLFTVHFTELSEFRLAALATIARGVQNFDTQLGLKNYTILIYISEHACEVCALLATAGSHCYYCTFQEHTFFFLHLRTLLNSL